MGIYLGSRLRVELPFVDIREDGTEAPIDLTGVSDRRVRIIRPDRTEVESPELTIPDPASGVAYWEGVMDAKGAWKVQGVADGYLSAPVSWRVHESP